MEGMFHSCSFVLLSLYCLNNRSPMQPNENNIPNFVSLEAIGRVISAFDQTNLVTDNDETGLKPLLLYC